jgi:glycosyltransferase involved in cell wall biosynthesis
MPKRRSVAFVYPYLFQYRGPFHEAVRALLGEEQVEYRLYYSSNPKSDSPRGDLISLPWATDVACDRLNFGGMQLRYQRAFIAALSADLVIFQQENALLVNYPLQIARWFGGPKTAFFGHGKNFQASNPGGSSERFKRFWANKVDWWFAYTERSAEIIRAANFPADRITVVNNAIDTSAIAAELAAVTAGERLAKRNELFGGSENVGVFVGALYRLKRMDFLMRASELIRKSIPDFHLLVIGGGEDAPIVESAARLHPWIHYVGPKFGREKSLLASLGKVFLMPGAAGLAVLDSFAYGIPMVSTNYAFHGPEIDYLQHGRNGLKDIDAEDVESYAGAVVRLLTHKAELQSLRAGAKHALKTYTVQAMAERFSAGAVEALNS